jgi:dihydropteroate synthase
VPEDRPPIVLGPGDDGPPGIDVVDVETAAEAALAVVKGARVLRARDTRAARRAADVVAAILDARDSS